MFFPPRHLVTIKTFDKALFAFWMKSAIPGQCCVSLAHWVGAKEEMDRRLLCEKNLKIEDHSICFSCFSTEILCSQATTREIKPHHLQNKARAPTSLKHGSSSFLSTNGFSRDLWSSNDAHVINFKMWCGLHEVF